jgi:hypothetical protein
MKTKRMIPALSILGFAVLACTLGAQSPAGSVGLQTLTALAQNTATNITPQSDSTPSVTSTVQPVVRVMYVTGCRTGPDPAYDSIAVMSVGFETQPIGKDPTDHYLLVKLPTGEQCWLDNDYTSHDGDISTLPVITPPPSPTPAFTLTPHPPSAPQNLTGQKTCSTTSGYGIPTTTHYSIQLNWVDTADSGTDYFVEYGSTSLQLPVDATSAAIEVDVPGTGSLQVNVLAQNDVGQTSSETKTFTCP